MPYWFLASPYSKYPGGLDAACDAAIDAAGVLLQAGIPAYSPIVQCHPIAKRLGIDPRDLAIWLPAEAPKRAAACGIIMLRLESWEISTGMGCERDEFAEAGKPIVWMDPGQMTPELLEMLKQPLKAPAVVAPKQPEAVEPVPPELQTRLFNQSLADIGECLVDLSTVLQQGFRVDNQARRGGIACGLERAAAHVRGQRYAPVVDPKHLKNKTGN